jgi:hypothetical protein
MISVWKVLLESYLCSVLQIIVYYFRLTTVPTVSYAIFNKIGINHYTVFFPLQIFSIRKSDYIFDMKYLIFIRFHPAFLLRFKS